MKFTTYENLISELANTIFHVMFWLACLIVSAAILLRIVIHAWRFAVS